MPEGGHWEARTTVTSEWDDKARRRSLARSFQSNLTCPRCGQSGLLREVEPDEPFELGLGFEDGTRVAAKHYRCLGCVVNEQQRRDMNRKYKDAPEPSVGWMGPMDGRIIIPEEVQSGDSP